MKRSSKTFAGAFALAPLAFGVLSCAATEDRAFPLADAILMDDSSTGVPAPVNPTVVSFKFVVDESDDGDGHPDKWKAETIAYAEDPYIQYGVGGVLHEMFGNLVFAPSDSMTLRNSVPDPGFRGGHYVPHPSVLPIKEALTLFEISRSDLKLSGNQNSYSGMLLQFMATTKGSHYAALRQEIEEPEFNISFGVVDVNEGCAYFRQQAVVGTKQSAVALILAEDGSLDMDQGEDYECITAAFAYNMNLSPEFVRGTLVPRLEDFQQKKRETGEGCILAAARPWQAGDQGWYNGLPAVLVENGGCVPSADYRIMMASYYLALNPGSPFAQPVKDKSDVLPAMLRACHDMTVPDFDCDAEMRLD